MSELRGTRALSVPTQQRFDDGVFPLILECRLDDRSTASATSWVAEHRDELVRLCEQHGTLLFRGFGLSDANDFDAFIRAFKLPNFTYSESLSNAVRINKTELVFTANEAPPDVSIHFHHEMAQTPLFPSKLFFFCEVAPTERGATPLCRSDILLDRLRERAPDFAARCEELGVKYTNVMPQDNDLASGQGRSWVSTLGSADQDQVESKLRSLGYSWIWRDDGSLAVTTPVLPAVRTLNDGRKVFFNQLIAAYCGWADKRNQADKSVRFGDDSPMDTAGMAAAVEISEELAFDVAWQTGDVALVDNFTVMHGRRPFAGKRAVFAALVKDDGTRLKPSV